MCDVVCTEAGITYRQYECVTRALGTELGSFARAVSFLVSPSLKIKEKLQWAEIMTLQTPYCEIRYVSVW